MRCWHVAPCRAGRDKRHVHAARRASAGGDLVAACADLPNLSAESFETNAMCNDSAVRAH
jgi:hypothetical protein